MDLIFLTTGFHLNKWATTGNNPNNYNELYNLRNSSTRNVIEFGLLKK